VRSLLGAELVDELVLMIEPITLGGKTLFPIDGKMRRFELTSPRRRAPASRFVVTSPRIEKGSIGERVIVFTFLGHSGSLRSRS